MLPTSLGLLLPAFGPARKGAAIGLWSAVGGAAAAFGPPIGGLLVEASWRWVFLVNLPISLVALFFGVRLLREIKDPVAHKVGPPGCRVPLRRGGQPGRRHRRGIELGLDERFDPWGLRPLGALGAWRSSCARGRHPNPIIEPAVIRHRAVALADASSLVFFAGFGAMVLGGVLFLTGVWHEPVLRAGFMIAPGPLVASLAAFPGGLLGSRFSHRAVGTVGSLLFAASAIWWITRIGVTPDYAGGYLPGSIIGGIGVGLMLPALGGAATAPLPPNARQRERRSMPCAGRSAWPSGSRASWRSSGHDNRARRGARLSPRLDLHGGMQPDRRSDPAGNRRSRTRATIRRRGTGRPVSARPVTARPVTARPNQHGTGRPGPGDVTPSRGRSGDRTLGSVRRLRGRRRTAPSGRQIGRVRHQQLVAGRGGETGADA